MAMMKTSQTSLPPGVSYLPGCLDPDRQRALLAELRRIIAAAPLYIPIMPRTGQPMSVQMTNCGTLGWVTDKDRGYRYQPHHPMTGAPWPAMPGVLMDIWRHASGYAALPEACLVNYYSGKARMGSHRDSDEADRAAPVVSVSLGDDAIFHVGGPKRSDPKARINLRSGDVLVLGGPSRMAYHGIDRLLTGTSTLLPEGGRFNLTLRRVTIPLQEV
jgi:DNA oxidative demethylase